MKFQLLKFTNYNNLKFFYVSNYLIRSDKYQIQTSTFDNFNADTFNVLLIPENNDVKNFLLAQGFPTKNVYGAYSYDSFETVQPEYVERDEYNYPPANIQLDETEPMMKYSEFPVQLIQ